MVIARDCVVIRIGVRVVFRVGVREVGVVVMCALVGGTAGRCIFRLVNGLSIRVVAFVVGVGCFYGRANCGTAT